MNTKEHAVAVALITPSGVPMIRDPKKPAPVFWKFPGGRGSSEETAAGTAVREYWEETGIKLEESDLSVIFQEDRGNHILTIFAVVLPTLPPMRKRGDEGEEIALAITATLSKLPGLFPPHKKWVGEILARTAATAAR